MGYFQSSLPQMFSARSTARWAARHGRHRCTRLPDARRPPEIKTASPSKLREKSSWTKSMSSSTRRARYLSRREKRSTCATCRGGGYPSTYHRHHRTMLTLRSRGQGVRQAHCRHPPSLAVVDTPGPGGIPDPVVAGAGGQSSAAALQIDHHLHWA